MLEKAGFVEEGKAAKENFNLLMKGGSVNKLQKQTEPGDSEQETGKDGEQSVEKKQSDPVEKDEMPSGSGASKKTGADEKENESDAGAVKKPDP